MAREAQGTKHEARAFTLVEMSIVLSIIGLILGGIVLGKVVVRRTQINSVAVSEQQYVQAAMQFQQKYGMLPGDFSNATTYWGSLTTAGLTCPATYGTTNTSGGTLTCNGNGDGVIYASSGSIDIEEEFLFWQHLANAQMIQGSYTGIAGSAGTNDNVIGTNAPLSRVQNAGFCAKYLGTQKGNPNYFNGSYGHMMMFGNYAANACPHNPALTALEAMEFDNKYDDGLPGSGNIRSFESGSTYSPSCATSGTSSTATYATSTIGPQCSLIFITGF